MLASSAAGVLICIALLGWSIGGADPPVRQMLGMADGMVAPVPRTLSIVLAPGSPWPTPPLAVLVAGGRVTFRNDLAVPVTLRAAGPAPAAFAITVASHLSATLTLARPGVYQYYDTRTARVRHIVAGSAVLAPLTRPAAPRQGWIVVVDHTPGLQQNLVVPPRHDLFTPKALAAVEGSTILVSNHDEDAHNFAIDPASPVGAAFVVNGTKDEPPHGWQHVMVVQHPGLYHVYCTLHTRIVGRNSGWLVVVPQHQASGYADGNPMEAWILVLPAGARV